MSKLHRTVLVIDDTAQNDRNYEHQLQQDATFSYQVLTQQSDASILVLCRSGQIDGILFNLSDSGSSRFQILDQLQQDLGERCPPIVVIGSDDAAIVVQAFKRGATDYLIKTRMTADDLRLTMRKAIEHAELQSSQKPFEAITDTDDPKQLVARLRDEIVDRQRTEKALRTANQKFSNILDSITDAVAVLDRSWRYTYVNQTAIDVICTLTQLEPKDWLDKTHWELFPSLVGQPIEQEYRRAMVEQVPLQVEVFYEPTGNWFEARLYPSGEGVTIYFHNIDAAKHSKAESKRSEEALRRSEERFRISQDLSLYAFTILESVRDASGKIIDFIWTYANPRAAEILQRPVEDLIGQRLLEVLPGNKLNSELFEHYVRVVETGEPHDIELPYNSEGISGWFHNMTVKLDDGIAISFSDITERKRAELVLRENQAQLQQQLAEIEAIYQSAPIGLAVLDQDLRFVRINQRLAEINGFSVEAHIGRTVRELLPELADSAEALLRPILETGKPRLNVELHGETPAQYGVKRTWLEHFLPIQDGQKVIGINIVCEEITERLQAQLALQDANIQLEAALEAGSIYTWRWDVQRNVTTISRNLANLFGIEAETPIVEMPIEEVIDRIHPDDRDQVAAAIDHAIATGETYTMEYRIHDVQGQERWVIARGRVEYDETGNAVSFPGALADITDRKHAEEERKQVEAALRRSEARFRRLIESNLIGVILWTLDGAICEANDAFLQMVGYSREDLLAGNLRWLDITPTEWLEQDRRGSEQILATGTCGPFEKEYFRKDGTRVPVMLGSALLEGSQERGVSFVLDLSDRKQAEQERERLLAQEKAAREAADSANRIKDEFLAILSHELRTPLNPILGWAQLLQLRQFDATKTSEALSTIERNARLQIQLVDDLLDMAKILRGKLTLDPRPIDLSMIVSAAIETVRTAVASKSLSLHIALADIGQVMGDAARLQQVVWNLLSNAIKFTPPKGHITIRLDPVGNEGQITVSDTGKGISPDFLPYLFESFRQEDTSTTRKYGGLGLGLAIVRQLVEAHGGTVRAESLGEGQGATFTVRLPLLKTQAKIPESGLLPEDDLNLSGIRVLAVDDDADSRDLVAVVLGEYGAEVRVVASGAEVLMTLESLQPDVLISDIGMPEMDGYELIHRIRSRPPEKGGQVSAIALTAYAKEEDRRRALASGYQYHVSKPLEAEELARVVMALTAKLG